MGAAVLQASPSQPLTRRTWSMYRASPPAAAADAAAATAVGSAVFRCRPLCAAGVRYVSIKSLIFSFSLA